jgi:adenylate cyclase
MATEIERKFLLRNDSWRDAADAGTRFRQGYLIGAERASVRVRIEGEVANLNIKSATLGIERQEYEYPIPLDDARQLLDTLCEQPQIEKIRYHVSYGDHLWEVDVFAGANAGLVVAEVELQHADEPFAMPPWAGEEVSHDTRYYNVCLAKHPYCEWNHE